MQFPDEGYDATVGLNIRSTAGINTELISPPLWTWTTTQPYRKTRDQRDMRPTHEGATERAEKMGGRGPKGKKESERRGKRPKEDGRVSGTSGTMVLIGASAGTGETQRPPDPGWKRPGACNLSSTHAAALFNFHQTTEPPTVAHQAPTTTQRPALFAPLTPASDPAPAGLAQTGRFPRNPRSRFTCRSRFLIDPRRQPQRCRHLVISTTHQDPGASLDAASNTALGSPVSGGTYCGALHWTTPSGCTQEFGRTTNQELAIFNFCQIRY
jgi:hypothetical protein